jgi:hypothetical protein
MNVWFCIPSARPIEEAKASLSKWRKRGYRIALWRDKHEYAAEAVCDFLLTGKYPGYANAVNAVVGEVLKLDPQCRWIVAGGDDMEPDENRGPEEIAGQCEARFGAKGDPTFGVMQPTGDRWGEAQGSAYADRVAGSPWIGRRFCETVNGGNGPLWHEYFHMGVDDELQAVATRLGVFWQRPDLSHFHRHWARSQEKMPAFLAKANSPQEWEKYKHIFRNRQASGFPGHQPVAAVGDARC